MPDANTFLSRTDSGLKLWDFHRLKCLRKFDSGLGIPVSATPDGRHVVSYSDNSAVYCWDLKSGAIRSSFTADAPITACAISREGTAVIAGDATGKAHILHLDLDALSKPHQFA